MVALARSRVIDAAPERLWPLIDAIERHREWDARVVRGESLDRGAIIGVGRRERLHQRMFGTVIEVDLVVTEREPPVRVAWRTEAWRAEGRTIEIKAQTFSFDLEPVDGGTQIEMTLTYEPAGPLQHLQSWLARRWELAELDRALEQLASITEAPGTASQPVRQPRP